MPAHQRADRLAERAVGRAFFDVGELGVEALRVADREFERVLARDGDQLVGFVQFDRDGFFEEYVLAGSERVARHRKVQHFGRRRDHHRVDRIVMQDLLIIGGGGLRAGGFGHFSQPLGARFREMQALHQRVSGAGLGADAAAPAGADDADVDLLQREVPLAWMPTGA